MSIGEEEPAASDGDGSEAVELRLRPWSALDYGDYRWLWAASVTWMLTQQLRLLVTAVWLFDETGSAAQLGIVGGVQLIVQVPALLYGGTMADRVDRKRLIAAMQAITFAVAQFVPS